MAVKTEGVRYNDVVKWEAGLEFLYAREEVTVTGVHPTGEIMGKITATGKYVAWDESAADGSENGAGILVKATTAAGDQQAAVVVRDAVVSRDGLMKSVEYAAATAPQRTALEAELAALGIVTREGL